MPAPTSEEGRPADRGYAAGARAGLPFAVATVVLGVSFGVLARQLGWGVVAPIVCSTVVFSGSAQFAVASILGAGGGVGTATLAAVFVNARFLPMGLALAPLWPGAAAPGARGAGHGRRLLALANRVTAPSSAGSSSARPRPSSLPGSAGPRSARSPALGSATPRLSASTWSFPPSS